MAKRESLQSQTAGTSTAVDKPGFKMPAVFGAPPNRVQARAWAPYITFAHPKKKDEWNKLTGKFRNVEEGDMYFIHGDRVEKLDVAKLSPIRLQQYWIHKAAGGTQVVATSYEERGDPFDEYIECAALLYLPDRIYPVNVQFRTTKCPIGKALDTALNDAQEPSWGDRSPEHKATLVLEQPFLRFYGECVIAEPRPGKKGGMPYRPGQCTIKPTGVVEFQLIKAFQEQLLAEEQTESKTLLEMVANRFQSNIDDVNAKLQK